MTPVRLLLVGMMGSGKSTVGAALSERTGWPYVDNDALVAELAGVPTPEVAARLGADELHVLEVLVVHRILEQEPPLVAGIPGSAVANDALRAELRAHGHVVWLRASMETLAARIGTGASRPLFAGTDVLATLRSLYTGREALYADAAHQILDVEDRTPAQLADQILAALPNPAQVRE